VDLASSKWEARDVELGSVCRIHDFAVRIADGDGRRGNSLVMDRHCGGAEVSSTAGVGDGRSGS
jgi:hypothetical protein